MPMKGKDSALPDLSLGRFLRDKCRESGQKVAIVDSSEGGKSLTFDEVLRMSGNCAAFLHQNGVKVGDFIGICAPNSLGYVTAMLGILGTGAALTYCSPGFSEGEIVQQFMVSEPKMVIVHETAVETMKKVQVKLPCIETIYVIGKSEESTTLETICETPGDLSFLNELRINPSEDVAILPYSSGTTGLPKSVMLTHKNLISTICAFAVRFDWIKKDAVLYMDRPMYHGGGFVTVFVSLSLGMKLIFERQFKIDKMLKTIEKYKVNYVLTVAPVIIELVNAQKAEQYDTSSLICVMGGGAAIAPDTRRKIEEKFKVFLTPAYGMTEGGIISFGKLKNDFISVGTVCPNTEVKVIAWR